MKAENEWQNQKEVEVIMLISEQLRENLELLIRKLEKCIESSRLKLEDLSTLVSLINTLSSHAEWLMQFWNPAKNLPREVDRMLLLRQVHMDAALKHLAWEGRKLLKEALLGDELLREALRQSVLPQSGSGKITMTASETTKTSKSKRELTLENRSKNVISGGQLLYEMLELELKTSGYSTFEWDNLSHLEQFAWHRFAGRVVEVARGVYGCQ
jgi:hypothetical protein